MNVTLNLIDCWFTKLMAMSCCWQRRGRIRIYFFEMNWVHYGLTTNDGKMQIMEEERVAFADSWW